MTQPAKVHRALDGGDSGVDPSHHCRRRSKAARRPKSPRSPHRRLQNRKSRPPPRLPRSRLPRRSRLPWPTFLPSANSRRRKRPAAKVVPPPVKPAAPAAPAADVVSNSQDDIDALLAMAWMTVDGSAEEIRAPEPEPLPDGDVLRTYRRHGGGAMQPHPDAAAAKLRFSKIEPRDDLEFAEAQSPRPPPAPSYAPVHFERTAVRKPAGPADPVAARPSRRSNPPSTTLANTVLSNNARTLEDLVKEMLRPMLKSWLDDNLPGLVERIVKAEIERVSRGGRCSRLRPKAPITPGSCVIFDRPGCGPKSLLLHAQLSC